MKKHLAILSASVLSIGLIASSLATANNPMPTVQQPQPMTPVYGSTSKDAVLYNNAAIKLSQALAIAQKQALGATVVEASFDDDNGGEYEIVLYSPQAKFEVDISAVTGQVIKQKQKRIKSDDLAELQAYNVASIKLNEALKRAEQIVNGSKAYDVEFDDNKNGLSVYDIKVATPNHQSHEIRLDANTGAVLKQKLDR